MPKALPIGLLALFLTVVAFFYNVQNDRDEKQDAAINDLSISLSEEVQKTVAAVHRRLESIEDEMQRQRVDLDARMTRNEARREKQLDIIRHEIGAIRDDLKVRTTGRPGGGHGINFSPLPSVATEAAGP